MVVQRRQPKSTYFQRCMPAGNCVFSDFFLNNLYCIYPHSYPCSCLEIVYLNFKNFFSSDRKIQLSFCLFKMYTISCSPARSLVPQTAHEATQPTQFSGLTESAADILKDNPDCNDHPSQSQSEMKQSSQKEHQSPIAMPDKTKCLLRQSDGVVAIRTTESDGRDKTQRSALKSYSHIGDAPILKPVSNGGKKLHSQCRKVRGTVDSENKKKEAKDQKNDKNSKTIKEAGNTELQAGFKKNDDSHFKDSPPSPLNSDQTPPKIHKRGAAKVKLESRTVQYSASKSDGFGRKTARTDRKPLLYS